MPRATRARIDLAALRDNYRRARKLAPSADSMAVIKADGYGHGLQAVATALSPLSQRLAVATITEAQQVRDCGVSNTLVLMEGPHEPDDWRLCQQYGFEPVLHDAHQLESLLEQRLTRAQPVWLKCNTGMNRLGFEPEAIPALAKKLDSMEQVKVMGVMTHFACADDPPDPMTQRQLKRFQSLFEECSGLWFSAANSAAHFHDSQCHLDWTRPGIMLYGGTPLLGSQGPDLGLRPVMKLESRLIATRTIEPGDCVGYGATWTAEKRTHMGIVEIGYGDGYPRHAPNGTPVAVNGYRCSLIGRVSMDMLAVDLDNCPEAGAGAPVELWGDTVCVDEVASLSGTISYELLTGVSPRVPRVYENEDSA